MAEARPVAAEGGAEGVAHVGEEGLGEALQARGAGGFRHKEHSLRVVDVLERVGEGLNLTEQVRDGILNHTGPTKPATLEGRVVKLVDRVAYINHDIDDAVRAGILHEADLPAKQIELLGPTGAARIDTLVRDIVEVISAHTDLRRSGTRYTGLCPFHDERSPSFSVDPTEKLYHCFGCGVGGDVIKFVEEKEGLAFPDAVEALADRYGVELEREA